MIHMEKSVKITASLIRFMRVAKEAPEEVEIQLQNEPEPKPEIVPIEAQEFVRRNWNRTKIHAGRCFTSLLTVTGPTCISNSIIRASTWPETEVCGTMCSTMDVGLLWLQNGALKWKPSTK